MAREIVESCEPNDSVAVQDADVGRDLMVNGGLGEDEVTLTGTQVERALTISTGSQSDEIGIFDSSAGRLSINTGTGSDAFQYSGGVVTGPTTIVLGAGSDVGILAELRVDDSPWWERR